MLGCAQSETAAAVGAGLTSPPAPAPATDACAGLMPAAAGPSVDLVLCGFNGNAAAFAFGDAHGDLALGCATHDAGPGAFFGLYMPMNRGYVSKAPLGYSVWAQPDGFIGVSKYPAGPFEQHERDGGVVASQTGAHVLAGPHSLLVASVSSAGIAVAPFGGTPQVVAPAPANVSIAGAGDVNGNTLLIWQTYGETSAHARWLGPDGAPLGDAFALAAWMQAEIPDPAPLADGSLAIATHSGPMWRGVIRAPQTAESDAPAWLTTRATFFLARGGAAVVFPDGEVFAADGTSCGNLGLGAPVVGVGLDGTAVTAPDAKTFRMFPQLLQ